MEPVLEKWLDKRVVLIVNMSPLTGELSGYDSSNYIIDSGHGPGSYLVVTRSKVDMIMLAETWEAIQSEEQND